jgi:uncharacterized protein YciW
VSGALEPSSIVDGDFIDSVLGLAPGSRLDALRRGRAEVRLRLQTSWAALFAPKDFGALSAHERFAVARRVAEISGAERLARRCAKLAPPTPQNARLDAILAHAETVGRAPHDASRAELVRLAGAGLSPTAIVVLSQIIGFVATQVRVLAALALLGETS